LAFLAIIRLLNFQGQLKIMKNQVKFILSSLFLFLLALSFLAPSSLGALSYYLSEFNAFFLGDFGLFLPFILLPLNFIFFKRKYDLDLIKKSEFIGLCLAFLSLMILFAILGKNAGFVPEIFYTIFGALLGRTLCGLVFLALLLFSLALIFPKSFKALFGIELKFEKLARLDERLKNTLYGFFGQKNENLENETKSTLSAPNLEQNLKENSQNESLKDENKQDLKELEDESLKSFDESLENLKMPLDESLKENSSDEMSENYLIKPNLNEQVSKKEELKEILDENLEEKNYISSLNEPKNSSSSLQSFIERASKEANVEQKEVFIPERFLKPAKNKDIDLDTNLDEPSFKRQNISLEGENKELSLEQEPLKFEEDLNLKENLSEDTPFIITQVSSDLTKKEEIQNEPKQNDDKEFMPIVSEVENEPKDDESAFKESEKLDLVQNKDEKEEIKKVLASLDEPALNNDFKPLNDESLSENLSQNKQIQNENLNLQNDTLKTPVLKPQVKVSIQTSLSSNEALMKDIEKGQIQKPVNFTLPPLDFLVKPTQNIAEINEQEIDKKIYDLLEKLRRFKIGGDVISTYTGPVVTTFEFRPSADVKVSRILNLQDDLAMALKATSIRIQAPIPGKDVVGIEVPNESIQTIYLREILESKLFKSAKSELTLVLGKDIVGNAFITDLKKLPHLLIAGTTGSGKSVGINAMLLSLLYRNSPQSLRLMMIDPKMLEFSIYNEIPHLLTPVITDPKKAVIALSNMVAEMERRYKLMADARTKNIENYNEKMKELGQESLPYIVVIIDELADLMMTAGKDVEFYIGRLAQMARASGIHLIVATQRPSVDVVTGLIKANLPSRLAYKVGQKIDSKVILDAQGAESLLGRGDCLFTPPGTSNLVRLHAPFASEFEIEKIVEFLKAQQGANYDESFLKDENSSKESINLGEFSGELDELFEQAKAVILEDQKTSISYLQRRLKIGYNRAANIIEQLTQKGFLSEPDSKGQREIL